MATQEIPSGHYLKADGTLGKLAFDKAATSMDSAADVSEVNRVLRETVRRKKTANDKRDEKALLNLLAAVAEDNAEAEAEALGLNGEDSSDALNTRYQQDLNTERERWNGISKRNMQVSQLQQQSGRYAAANNKTAKAADSVAANAKRAKGYSMFATSASIIKRQATA